MSVQSILKVEHLTKTYATAAGPLTVLHEVSFAIPTGGTCAIVGPSGSGKTTLLGLCAGLDQPSTGSVQLDGREIGGLSEDQRALVRNQCVGFVFQNFQLIPTLTAAENVLVPLELRGNGLPRRSFCWASVRAPAPGGRGAPEGPGHQAARRAEVVHRHASRRGRSAEGRQ